MDIIVLLNGPIEKILSYFSVYDQRQEKSLPLASALLFPACFLVTTIARLQIYYARATCALTDQGTQYR